MLTLVWAAEHYHRTSCSYLGSNGAQAVSAGAEAGLAAGSLSVGMEPL